MTRIVAGRWSGRRLATPPGDTTRPTAEKVRAAVANSLSAAGALDGALVLDLYAGSGALALELVSRGAAGAVLVERSRPAQQAIRTNIAALGARTVTLVAADVSSFAVRAGAIGEPGEARGAGGARRSRAPARSDAPAGVRGGREFAVIGNPNEVFDVVVADPPYAETDAALAELLTSLERAGRLAPGADLVLERASRGGEFPWPAPLAGARTRRYGDTLVCYGHAP